MGDTKVMTSPTLLALWFDEVVYITHFHQVLCSANLMEGCGGACNLHEIEDSHVLCTISGSGLERAYATLRMKPAGLIQDWMGRINEPCTAAAKTEGTCCDSWPWFSRPRKAAYHRSCTCRSPQSVPLQTRLPDVQASEFFRIESPKRNECPTLVMRKNRSVSACTGLKTSMFRGAGSRKWTGTTVWLFQAYMQEG